MMENEYQTKEMKPAAKVEKPKAPKVVEDGKVYKEKGIWKFKIGKEVYQYRSKEKAEAGLKSLNG